MPNKSAKLIHYCKKCGAMENSVIDSRATNQYVRRRRRCDACAARWTTVEITEADYKFLLKRRSFEQKISSIAKQYVRQLEPKEQAGFLDEIFK